MSNTDWITYAGRPANELIEATSNAVKSRIKRGAYTQADIAYVARLSRPLIKDKLELSETQLTLLRNVCQNWDPQFRDIGIRSHRPIIGPVIVALKRALFPLVKLFLKDTLRQQREFNASVTALLAQVLSKK
jgi:hypothetical protein